MKKILTSFSLFIAALAFISLPVAETAMAQRGIIPSLGGARSGTSGFQFLKIMPDARSAGLGGSAVADITDGSSLYWNPALAVQMESSQFMISHTAYFVDISMNYASYVHQFRNMAFGGSILFLDSGDMNETTEFNPTGTGRTFRTVHMAAGLSFSQELTSLFSYGVTAKYLNERIEEIETSTVVLDLGFFYRVGDTGLRFAVGLNNFGTDASPSGETRRMTLDGEVIEDEFEKISPPTTFIIGAAYDTWSNDNFDLVLTGQLTNPSDNAEQFSLGAELTYLNQFYLRTGYQFGVDEVQWPSFGAGFNLPVLNYSLGVDYGFSTRERLGSLHRIALKFNL